MKSIAARAERARLAILTLSLAMGMSSAYAAGTDAGTSISNTATVSYQVNSVQQTDVNSNAAVFVVDRKIDVNVTATGVTTQPNTLNVATTFLVNNEGNLADSFTLNYSYISGVDVSTGLELYFDTDSSGTFNAGDTLVANNTVVAFAEDEVRRYFVVADIPNTATNGQSSLVRLTATTTTAATPPGPDNPATVQVVYAEGAGPTYDGAISGDATYSIVSAALTVTKAAVVVSDPTGNVAPNAKAIPGATVEYTITVNNAAGAQSATTVVATDAIPATTTYVLGTISKTGGTAPAPTDANVVGQNLTVPIGTLAASGSATITFRVTIN